MPTKRRRKMKAPPMDWRQLTGVKERVEGFDRENGGNAILSEEWWYYANGATRQFNPMGALCDPPTDEMERLRLRLHYAKLVVTQTERAFNEATAAAKANAKTTVSKEQREADIAELRRLRNSVMLARHRWHAINDEIKAKTPAPHVPFTPPVDHDQLEAIDALKL